jgi:hypothetical protein
MGKTLRPGVLAHLDADKLKRLNALAKRKGIARSVLIREAVDDLLKKFAKKARK